MVVRKPHVVLERTASPDPASMAIEIREFIQEIHADLKDLNVFYNVSISPTRIQRFEEYLRQRSDELKHRFGDHFDSLNQESKVDFLLIKAFLKRQQSEIQAQSIKSKELEPLLGKWALGLVELCERRQKVVPTSGKEAATLLTTASVSLKKLSVDITKGSFKMHNKAFAAYRAAQALDELRSHLTEWYGFYKDYDPVFTWWTSKPWEELSQQLLDFAVLVKDRLVGIKPGDEDAIVGQPIGREGIYAELEAEMIPYLPEDLIKIGEREYEWCEKEAIKASQEMGFGKDWLKALEHVKNTTYVEPGQQTQVVHELAAEAVEYVTKHNMVTIPKIANETWRTFMMSPERQKVNPFFLGGTSIIVSYPTDTMSHQDKLMVMRGNCRPFSRSTVFHELIPGHHLQYHYMNRINTHRKLFQSPFWIEGWAFYWELILWDRGFADTPENRLGMLFWHMHRCARIVFSLKFHLGQVTPQECIDYLVEKVGHERATAEGEVRRSFNGDYGALYQAGYMLGALQLYALRGEIVDAGIMTEKQFHDRVLRENNMPIELLRALLKNEKLTADYKSSWKFYELYSNDHPLTFENYDVQASHSSSPSSPK